MYSLDGDGTCSNMDVKRKACYDINTTPFKTINVFDDRLWRIGITS